MKEIATGVPAFGVAIVILFHEPPPSIVRKIVGVVAKSPYGKTHKVFGGKGVIR